MLLLGLLGLLEGEVGGGGEEDDEEFNSPLTQLQQNNIDLETNFEKNITSIDDVVDVLMDSNFVTFLFSLLVAITWIVYITFYSSRVTGLLVTKFTNHFFRDGHIKIGKKDDGHIIYFYYSCL
jgi:hypothetical protein